MVSDYGSVAGIREKHGVAATMREAAAMAVEAGLDMELPDIIYYGDPLVDAAKERTGLHGCRGPRRRQHPPRKVPAGTLRITLRGCRDRPTRSMMPPHTASLARDAARKAIVLLKNEANTLPLSKTIKRIAVVGPCADSVLLGDYSGYGMKVVTLREGIAAAVPSAQVVYEKGASVGFDVLPMIPAENLIPAGGACGRAWPEGRVLRQHDLRRHAAHRACRSGRAVHLGHGFSRLPHPARAVLRPLDRETGPHGERRVPHRGGYRRRRAAVDRREADDRAVVRPRRDTG